MTKISVLQFKTTDNFEKNLQTLKKLFLKTTAKIVLAPEVCLTHFAYERAAQAVEFGQRAIVELLKLTKDRALILTIIEEKNNKFYNTAYVLANQKILYTQSKHKLFLLGKEDEFFTPSKLQDIKIFDLFGIKCGLLICFEFRFIDIWAKLNGAELILAPSMWGKPRKKHLQSLSSALAITNRCFVALANSANDDMAKSSAIISPWGKVTQDDRKNIITRNFNKREIIKLNRAIPIENM